MKLIQRIAVFPGYPILGSFDTRDDEVNRIY